jgi:membrane protein DedA with SNARE-associated domain
MLSFGAMIMAGRPRTRANPFYVLLLVASGAFTVTAFGYLIGPTIHRQALDHPRGGPGPGSRALADWLDRRGPTALAVELGVMVVAGCTAMATDRWFAPAPGRK